MINKWNVAILGARMDNSVSEALHESELLLSVYTDLNRSKENYSRSTLAKFLGKKIPRKSNVAASKVKACFAIFILAKILRRLDYNRTDLSRSKISNTINKRFATFCTKKNIHEAKFIYAMKGAAHEIFSQKRQNICVLEQSLITKYSEIANINRLLKIMNREDLLMNINDYRKIDQRNIEEIKLADVVICPSKFVQQDVLMRVPSANTVIIPYGVTNKKEGQVKIKHRVSLKKILTVGEVGLRKGSPSIWQIAKKFNHLEFEMIGPINLDEEFLRTKPSNVTLRGVQPYSEVSQAYLESDLFLLPSVAEGSATVIYEAVQHGLPVACSIQSGSVLENMSEAVIFDAFDLSDTARAISFLNDATIRKKYSEKATQKASLYTKEAYQAKVVNKLKDMSEAI